jgi:hypothetical protein
MLDLKKLKALEMPSEDVEVDILGEKQSVKVTAPDDEVAAILYGVGTENGKSDSEITIGVARVVLAHCVEDITKDDADLLLARALTTAVLPIVAKARDLRLKFDKAKAEAAKNAEKKSEPATSPTEKSCSSAAGNATI